MGNSIEINKQSIYRHILFVTKESLDELEIPFFLSSSTCLGYLREKNFIEHNQDIDIGIYYKDYTVDLIDVMATKGLHLCSVLGSFDSGLQLSFCISYQKVCLNIFIHDNTGPYTCWISYKNGLRRQHCVTRFNLIETDFLGIKINIPNPTKKYIEEIFGETWRIPLN